MCSIVLPFLVLISSELDGIINRTGYIQNRLWLLRTNIRRLQTFNDTIQLREDDEGILKGFLKISGRSRDFTVSYGIIDDEPTLCASIAGDKDSLRGKACRYAAGFFLEKQAKWNAILQDKWILPLRALIVRLLSDYSINSCDRIVASSRSLQSRMRLEEFEEIFTRSQTMLTAKVNQITSAHREVLHTLRLSVKRLRYSLEPTLPRLKEEVDALHSLQGSLGHINDLFVLTTSLQGLTSGGSKLKRALAALGEDSANLTLQSVQHLRTSWFIPPFPMNFSASAPISSLICKLASALRTQQATPHEDGLEVERRWILSALPPALSAWYERGISGGGLPTHGIRVEELSQGYLPGRTISD